MASGQKAPVSRLLHALAPWLDQVVLVGGWAHRLYRFHPWAQPLNYPPLMTLDADVALPEDVKARNIRERLLAAGFLEERLGDSRPPVTHYVLEESGFYAEFLSPLTGPPHSRAGTTMATAMIGGIVTQRLRHLDLLLLATWKVEIAAGLGFSAGAATHVRIPNAASFLAQKLLVYRQRAPRDRAKDVLYIHDTLEVFAPNLSRIREQWLRDVKPHLHPRASRIVERAEETHFSRVDDVIRNAARAAAGRSLSPERIAHACRTGWGEIFSG
jgi:hypothetical protein